MSYTINFANLRALQIYSVMAEGMADVADDNEERVREASLNRILLAVNDAATDTTLSCKIETRDAYNARGVLENCLDNVGGDDEDTLQAGDVTIEPGEYVPTTRALFHDDCDPVHARFEDVEGIVTLDGSDSRLQASIDHNAIVVGIDSPEEIANLAEEVTSITVATSGEGENKVVLRLTWREARQLAASLWQVTNVAEFG